MQRHKWIERQLSLKSWTMGAASRLITIERYENSERSNARPWTSLSLSLFLSPFSPSPFPSPPPPPLALSLSFYLSFSP